MVSGPDSDEEVPVFYIGHHDVKREYPITQEVVDHSQDCNYDMITAAITTTAFYTRVSSILVNHLNALARTKVPNDLPPPVLGSISCADTAYPETHLKPNSFIPQLILTSASWIDLASPDPLIADVSRQVFSLEVQYAAFCGAANIIVPGPALGRCGQNGLSNFTRALHEVLPLAPFVTFHISLPMGYVAEPEASIFSLTSHARIQFAAQVHNGNETTDAMASWDAWNFIRTTLDYSGRIAVALIIPKDLPSMAIQTRWFSEPLRIIELPSSSFIKTQGRSEVTFTQAQKAILFRYMRLRTVPWLLLSNIGALPGVDRVSGAVQGYPSVPAAGKPDPTPAQANQPFPTAQPRMNSYLNYVRQLQDKQHPKDAIERFSAGYQDYLQNPLQPLTDNLESMTYEVFEKDPIKYDWYERATAAALRDWQLKGKPCSGRDGRVVIAVVGAGRGPLVTRALEASQTTGVKADVWAVEKNQNAFALLQRHFSEKWHQRVNLARSDMRSWKGPFYYSEGTASSPRQKVHYKVDILISELLGSFADNELSPECLDGVQHVMAPTYGISIPSSYTAHFTPIAAPKIHMDITTRITQGTKDAAEIPYVVMLHAIDFLSIENPRGQNQDSTKDTTKGTLPAPVIRQAWDFVHPTSAPQVVQAVKSDTGHGNEHNRRFCRVEFACKDRGVCHGLGGYFETVLYDPGTGNANEAGITSKAKQKQSGIEKVELSTNPLTMDAKSKEMISWFPIFFPLKQPLYFPDNTVLSVSMWRQTDGRKVWYEWQVESFLQPEGQTRIRLGLTELHSSVQNACLM